jgi:hypothetical protein
MTFDSIAISQRLYIGNFLNPTALEWLCISLPFCYPVNTNFVFLGLPNEEVFSNKVLDPSIELDMVKTVMVFTNI